MPDTASAPPAELRFRLALYSHDTCGLGHVRRNLLIAQTLAQHFPGADLLLISGAREAALFSVPERVDVLTLPSLFKQADGSYRARRFSLDIGELVTLRSRIIQTALDAFQPDVFLVDNVPRGAMRELEDVLGYLRTHTSTRCVLGLRDVLDHPDAVGREWAQARNAEAIHSYYDAVWIYGDPSIYDAASAYAFPDDVRAKVAYTGYLDARTRLVHDTGSLLPAPDLPDGPVHLCVVGGGQDGARLADAFAAAPRPSGVTGLLVTGPFMPPEARLRLQQRYGDRLVLVPFVTNPTRLYQRAERVVTMGGYNTVSELLSLGKPTLIVPRLQPRQEQWIRACALQQRGLVDVLHPADATADAIGRWLHQPPRRRPDVHQHADMQGLPRLLDYTRALVSAPERSLLAPMPHAAP